MKKENRSFNNQPPRNIPFRVARALKPSDFWSLRIGDYRAIFEIDRAKEQVIVLFIGYRKKVYDDFSKML
jgi:mRNA-degrading endonuclease RelE of RelBE toxin-antitoxin system